MSARNMVRNLRDSGVLDTKPESPAWGTTAAMFAGAVLLGAFVYLGASYGLPGLIEAVQKKPPPVSFAKPDNPSSGLELVVLERQPDGGANQDHAGDPVEPDGAGAR